MNSPAVIASEAKQSSLPKTLSSHGLLRRPAPRNDNKHHHEENCKECHDHSHHEHKTNTKSLMKKIHLHNGHACTDHSCEVKEPHGHVTTRHREPVKDGRGDPSMRKNGLLRRPAPRNDNASFTLKPLSEIILKSKMPHIFKEFAINVSFLSPALIISNIAKAFHMPDWLSAWLAIGSMHGINRGTNKLGRLSLTMSTSLAANIAKSTGMNSGLVRFIATSMVAIIEKFSNGLHSHHHHHHDHSPKKKVNHLETMQKELGKFFKNLGDIRYWKELLPSVANVEAKVQILSPIANYLTSTIAQSKNPFIKIPLQVLLTSASFVGSDQILRQFASIFGEGSPIAAAIGGICGCCGSTVCAAAATDTAMSNSTFNM